MSFRITTNGLFRGYQSNLHKNTKKLNDSMLRVETGRKFNTYAEEPVAASKAFQLRRDFWRTGDQIDTSNSVISKYETAYSAMGTIIDGDVDHPGLDGLLATIRGVSDTAGSGRVSLGQQLVATSESIVAMMNSKLGEDYLFAGADGANLPFKWGEDGKTLLYRGVDVNSNSNLEELKAMSKEATYVDIGLGMTEDDDGNLIEASAFNSAISGLDFLGYGQDQNLAVIMRELGTIFANADPNTGAFAEPTDQDRAYELYDKLHEAINNAQSVHVKLSTDANYLKTNLTQLETTKLQLNEQIEETEQGDPAAAITEMSWAQYCYNAALRIGNEILSQSLFDYMR